MGTWSETFDGNDTAADWFADALRGAQIDRHLDEALRYDDSYAQCRAAVYLLTVLGASAYVWPGDLDRLDDHVQRAAARMEAMLDPEHAAHQELVELWGSADSSVFGEIRKELEALRAAHPRRLGAP